MKGLKERREKKIGIYSNQKEGKLPVHGSVIVLIFTFPGYGRTLYKLNRVKIYLIAHRSPARIRCLRYNGMILGRPDLVSEIFKS